MLAGAGVPLLGIARPTSEASATTTGVRFSHGVASGDPGPDRVVLWTRVQTDPASTAGAVVAWCVARDPRLVSVVASGTAVAGPDADGVVQVEVTGLDAGTTYWYGFEIDSQQSPAGRTKTLPAPGAARVRVAVLTCGNLEAGWFNAYARVAERDDVDLVVHLGDYVYEYGEDPDGAPPVPGRAHHPRIELRALADYRARYRQYRSDPDLQHLHARHPVVSIYDDHEVADDTWAGGAQAHGPEDGDFEARRRAALQAWREWHPRSRWQPEVWRGLDLAGLVDLSVVDGRSHRPHRGDVHVAGSPDDALGPSQREWLLARLARPAGRWPVVCTQQPVFRRLGPDGGAIGEAGWSGFPAAQLDLLSAVRRAEGSIVSGDVHTSWLIEDRGVVEAVVPSATSRSMADRHGADHAATMELAFRAANQAVAWIDLQRHGYLLIDADPERCRFEWWFVDAIDERTAGQRLAHAVERRAR